MPEVTMHAQMRSSIGRYIAECELAANRTVQKTVEKGRDLAQDRAPVRSGTLRESIIAVMFSRTQGAFVAQAPWASYQEYGTAAHTMVGNQFFAFFWDEAGRWWIPGLFGEPDVIHHPGNPAHPFMKPAYAVVSREIMKIAKAEYPG